jgi:hypothetical protein
MRSLAATAPAALTEATAPARAMTIAARRPTSKRFALLPGIRAAS